MTRVISDISISLDGYAAGRDQTREEPLGVGGERLHSWFFDDPDPGDAAIAEHFFDGVGAVVMGRRMFAGGEGPLDPEWRGWWGDEPPYHVPVFVLTHHGRSPIPMAGGTTFHFVTDGLEAAIAAACEAAGPDRNVHVSGGASTINQTLAVGLLDELHVHIAPIVLGGGERLFVGVGDLALEPVAVSGSSAVTHVRYRVRR